jgi:hypothetical protein
LRTTDVQDVIETLGIERWTLNAQDRKEWTVILREAKAKLKGPWSQRKRRILHVSV